MALGCVKAAPVDLQVDLCTSPQFKKNWTTPIFQPRSSFHQILSPLLFQLVGWPTGTSLPPCERVASSSDSPPINRYSTLSCAFNFDSCKRHKSLLSAVGVIFLILGSEQLRIYSSCVYSSVGCMVENNMADMVVLLSLFYVFYPAPVLSVLSLLLHRHYHNMNLSLASLVWALLHIYVLLSPSLPSVTSTTPACRLCCVFFFLMRGENLPFMWNSCHLTLLFQN